MEWETVIGLEIHCQLATDSKIFSGSSTEFGAEPNSQASAVDIALPGVLPVMNMDAAKMAVKFGLAVNAVVNERSVFSRKNYFYPDLPKGYQITQFEEPIVSEGRITINVDDREKVIGITRAHLEEDAGKSLHEGYTDVTGIDLNRAGIPLIEIVSEPDMRSPEEAVAYMRKIHALVRYLEISDGNMQEGSFRCDANISVRPKGEKKLGTRAEIKNINSFRFVDRAIRHEVERQIDIIEDGGEVVQETRLYDSNADETRSMRSKEDAHDYRYFPDPDLPPMVLTPELIEEIRATLPELPEAKRTRFVEQYSLDEKDAGALTATRELADYFEKATEATGASDEQTQSVAKTVANWVNGDLASYLNRNNLDIDDSPVSAKALGGLVERISDKTISNKIGKTVFEEMWKTGATADDVIDNQGLKQITDTGAIEKLVDEVIASHEEQAQQYRDGNEKVIGFLVGKIMQASQGKANPGQVNELLKSKLG